LNAQNEASFHVTTPNLSKPTPTQNAEAIQATRLARQALQHGDTHQARRYAAQAVRIAPDREEGWLIMAAVASPRASVAYLQKALEINPSSTRARAGMHWALQRLRTDEESAFQEEQPATTTPAIQKAEKEQPPAPVSVAPAVRRRSRRSPWAWVSLGLALLLLCMAVGFMTVTWSPVSYPVLSQAQDYAIALVYSPTPTFTDTPKPTLTSTATSTPIPSDTPTPTSSPTPLPTDTPTPTFTDTPTVTPTATETPIPTATFSATPAQVAQNPTAVPVRKGKGRKNPNPGIRPGNVNLSDRWIDVDLSAQTVFAMQGDQIVNRFLVSTGLWPNVTVTGEYRIYVKYRAADMSGPGYYLPDVPYVMYFYKGYGLHGTYWHNNFGHPMSHGCVNLRTPDAGWIFDWSSVGTVVSVHD
jgi:lipoprotein-anchoring transpeptidase ErfK/SrfK